MSSGVLGPVQSTSKLNSFVLLLPNIELLQGLFVFVGGRRHHNNLIIIGYIFILWRLYGYRYMFGWRVIKLTLDIFDNNSNGKKKT